MEEDGHVIVIYEIIKMLQYFHVKLSKPTKILCLNMRTYDRGLTWIRKRNVPNPIQLYSSDIRLL